MWYFVCEYVRGMQRLVTECMEGTGRYGGVVECVWGGEAQGREVLGGGVGMDGGGCGFALVI